jgi:hypothetical protein
MAIACDEAHGTLIRAGKIENRHAGAITESGAKLVQAVTIAGLQLAPVCSLENYRLASPAPAASTEFEAAVGPADACGLGVGTTAGLGASARTMSILPLK